jgi:propanediol dehydratase small subunit
MKELDIDKIVREVIRQMGEGTPPQAKSETAGAPVAKSAARLDPKKDYPLAEKRPELLHTATGKRMEDVTLEAVMAGKVDPMDVRITPETLRMQAEIAEGVGRKQLGLNLRRAAELSAVSDERLLEMYNALRPHRSSKVELLAMAEELDTKYKAKICSAFVQEAAEVYERRGLLRSE